MSRAFVKELDDAPPPPPLERPVSSAPNLVTPNGARLIEEEVRRIEEDLAREPAEAEATALRRDLRYWLARRASAQIVERNPSPAAAAFGTRVRIVREGRESEVTLVGEDEADPDRGLIAWTSPLARALIDAEAGDVVELEAGGRTVEIEVLAVEGG